MPAWSQFRMDASRHVSRGAGQSAVAAAAYRSGERLYDRRAEATHDYTQRFGVVATGLSMPERGGPTCTGRDWTREQLWNEAEAAERRKDARTARKIEMALPAEMTAPQRHELVRDWASDIANRYGVAVDWAIHLPDKEGDQRNHHVHLMLTTREIGPEGFLGKAALELSNTDQNKRGLAVGDDAMYALREALAERLNQVAERHGLDLHADPRSYAERGIDLTPTKHMGVHAVAMERRGLDSERVEDHAEVRRENARRIMARPELVLEELTEREAVFTRHDMARALHRHLDDPEQFRTALARLDASAELVRLSEGDTWESARFSTRKMVATEARMMEAAGALATAATHGVFAAHVQAAQARHARLSDEQREAVAHITAPGQIAAVAGAAGAGKSASLEAAREAWEAEGYRVRGAALAGKAAEALQTSAGIESRTLHALEYSWSRDRDPLSSQDILVIDEAGMVGSRQMGRVLEQAREAGAKVVLVGDARQLQPIEAGAAFRAVAEQIGVVEIETIRRQRQDWAREASQAFATGEIAVGVAAYAERGHVRLVEDREAAKAAIARDSLAAGLADGASLILAHTNDDVRDLNTLVRAERQRAGALSSEASFQTERGERGFAAGDRLVFLKNDRDLGVKNGTLATVEQAAPGQLVAAIDGGGRVSIDQATYAHIDHGYAVTLHKAQGATVDQTFVLASGGMDRHLAYVGMTRHRDAATLYAGRDDFKDEAALARRLSRARPKASTLDFAERRGFETEKPWLENARVWLDRGRERLAEAWDRAEQAFSVVRERFAGQVRAADVRSSDAPPERTAEQERAETLRASFRPEAERTPADRREELRAKFMRTQAAEAAKDAASDAAARREALRESFAKEGQTAPKTPEQLRQAMQERDKPAAERRQDKDRGHEIER
jgi:Ti-type conjugative transfer relaxase TraA